MGEISEMMLDGTLCASCGELLSETGGEGFPMYCPECDQTTGNARKSTAHLYKKDKSERKNKRKYNRINSTRILSEKKVLFTPKNHGQHLQIFVGDKCVADFWPSTGKYIFRNPNREGRGVFNLIKEIGEIRS